MRRALTTLSCGCVLVAAACQPKGAPPKANPPAQQVALQAGGHTLAVSTELSHSPGAAGFVLSHTLPEAGRVLLTPVLRLDGRPAPLTLTRVERVAGAIELVQHAGSIQLLSRLRFAAGARAQLNLTQYVSTRHLGGASKARPRVAAPQVQLGWRVEWPGRASFVPGVGFVEAGQASAPWLGRQMRGKAYALAAPAKRPLTLLGEHVGHLGAVSLLDVGVLSAGSPVRREQRLFIAEKLSEVGALAWKYAGIRVGTLAGQLSPAPAWAVVEARGTAGELVMRTRAAADGSWELAVPPGNYRLSARTPGGADSVELSLSAGERRRLQLVAPTPGALRFIARGAGGQPLPSRWIFRGRGGTADPALSAEPGLHENQAFSLSGTGEVLVPPGNYRVTATHGPEYSLHEEDVSISAGKGVVVRAELKPALDLSGWLGCDFHLHQAPSFDSEVSLPDRIASLVAEGVGFAAATDHNVVTDYGPVVARVAPGAPLRTVPGVEVTTQRWGHFNVFPYGFENPPPTQDLTPAQIFSELRSALPGSVIQVNHPRMGDIGYFNRGGLDLRTGDTALGFSYDFHTIEVFNGFDLGNPAAVTENLLSWYALLSNGWRFTAVGNSDSHRLTGQYAGYPRTYVRMDSMDTSGFAARVSDSLRRGQVFVSNGPRLDVSLGGKGLGETATAGDAGLALSVEIETAGFVSVNRLHVVVNGEERVRHQLEQPLKGGRAKFEFPLTFKQDSWVVVLARGDEALDAVLPGVNAMPLAFTNPIYVDRDGDGAFQAPRGEIRKATEARLTAEREQAAAHGRSTEPGKSR